MSKLFVLDANVILHDSSCLFKFEENDIALPIQVLETLDKFKKGNNIINYHAREFTRYLDKISGEGLFNGGICIGEGLGKLSILLERQLDDLIKSNFPISKEDNHILNSTYLLQKENPSREVILVSKDINLRMKAKSIGIKAEDYKNDQVENAELLYSNSHRIIDDVHTVFIESLYVDKFLDLSTVDKELFPYEFYANEYVILRNHSQSALAKYDLKRHRLVLVKESSAAGIIPRNVEQIFALDALLDPDIKLVSISGRAGTGKTLCALAAAIECRRNFRQIYVSRPIVALSDKSLGFLPGTAEEKIEPYMQPIYDNLAVINLNKNINTQELLDSEKIVVSPLAYIRGRSLTKIFYIIDEAQNLTSHEIKTIVTRAGENSKFVFTGDIYQIDNPYIDIKSNGLTHLIEKMRNQDIYAHINLTKGERSYLAELASKLL